MPIVAGCSRNSLLEKHFRSVVGKKFGGTIRGITAALRGNDRALRSIKQLEYCMTPLNLKDLAMDKSKPKRIRRGEWIELLEDINCIPSGLYRIESFKDGTFTLRVSSGIEVAVSNLSPEKFTHHRRPPGGRARVTAADFLPRYYELLDAYRGSAFDPLAPMTGAFIDVALEQLFSETGSTQASNASEFAH